MKMNFLFASVVVLGISSAATAEESQSTQPTNVSKSKNLLSFSRSENSVKGLRVAYVKDSFTGNVEATTKTESGTIRIKDSADVAHDMGIGAGYVYIPASGFGFRSQLLYNNYTKDTKALRLDLSMAYAFNTYTNMYLGVNAHKFTMYNKESESEVVKNILPGGQIGAGIQLTDTFGLDLSYVLIRNSGNLKNANGQSDKNSETNFTAQGLEVGLNATF